MSFHYDTQGRMYEKSIDREPRRYPLHQSATRSVYLVARQLRDALRENKQASASELYEIVDRRIARLRREARKSDCLPHVQPYIAQLREAACVAINTDRKDVLRKLKELIPMLHPGLDPV